MLHVFELHGLVTVIAMTLVLGNGQWYDSAIAKIPMFMAIGNFSSGICYCMTVELCGEGDYVRRQ